MKLGKTVRKISDNPFFNMPLCPSRKHYTPPAQKRIAAGKSETPVAGWAVGQYEHTCPDCGNVTRFGVFDSIADDCQSPKLYQEFNSAILGGASYPQGATDREIEKSKANALAFLRKQKRNRP